MDYQARWLNQGPRHRCVSVLGDCLMFQSQKQSRFQSFEGYFGAASLRVHQGRSKQGCPHVGDFSILLFFVNIFWETFFSDGT